MWKVVHEWMYDTSVCIYHWTPGDQWTTPCRLNTHQNITKTVHISYVLLDVYVY
jgi:hypothetical protein